MKKSYKYIAGIAIVFFSCIFIVHGKRNHEEKESYEKNGKEFHHIFSSYSFVKGEEYAIDDLASLTPFTWDKILFFGPYLTEERIIEIVGYKWSHHIVTGVSEGMNQVVFMNDKEVVCHIQGYPDSSKVYFQIEGYPEYKELQKSDQPKFRVTKQKKYYQLEYIEE